jgi:hypothetical protein
MDSIMAAVTDFNIVLDEWYFPFPNLAVALWYRGGKGFDPASITEAVGVEPDLVWHMGDLMADTGDRYQDSAWALRAAASEAIDILPVFGKLTSRVKPYIKRFAEVGSTLGIEPAVVCEVQLQSLQMPSLSFPAGTRAWVDEIGGSFEVEVVFNEYWSKAHEIADGSNGDDDSNATVYKYIDGALVETVRPPQP